MAPTLFHKFLAELVGTYLLVLFGCGVVHSAVLTGAQQGIWQVAIVWGVAVTVIIYVCGGVSGAHLNPAITLAQALWGRFRGSHVLPYFLAQFMGAFLAAATLYFLYGSIISAKVDLASNFNQQMGNAAVDHLALQTASCYGEYYPNPNVMPNARVLEALPFLGPNPNRQLIDLVPHHVAFMAEMLGTAILALVIFTVTDKKNQHAPPPGMAPIFIGLTLAALISIIGPLTQAGFNPARDFGPRVFAYFAGWGEMAIPGPNGVGFITVYIFAPFIGAIVGAGFYEAILRPLLQVPPRDMDLGRRVLGDDDV